MTLGDKVELLNNQANEIAFGWNDSGSFWHMRLGPRGSGNMMEGFGRTLSATETGVSTFEAAIDEFLRQLNLCDVPPNGWKCSRERGHDGPCAAIPMSSLELATWYVAHINDYSNPSYAVRALVDAFDYIGNASYDQGYADASGDWCEPL